MADIEENLVRELAEKQGIRDQREAYDLVFGAEWRRDAVNIDSETPIHGEVTPEMEALTQDVLEFCQVAINRFRVEFKKLMADKEVGEGGMGPVLAEAIKEKHLSPNFEIYVAGERQKILEQLGYEGFPLEKTSAIVVFNLPKPLAEWWWKGGVDLWGEKGEDVGGKVVEWGYFYRMLMDEIWSVQSEAAD